MDCSLIIPTLNRSDSLRKLLIDASCQTQLPSEIIIVNQGDEFIDDDIVPKLIRDTVVFINTNIKSLANARYLGMLNSNKEVLIYWDDDISPPEEYIETALGYLENNPDCNGVGGIYENNPRVEKNKLFTLIGRGLNIYSNGESNRILKSGWGDNIRGHNTCFERKSEWLFGCNMVYRKDVLSNINFPNEMMTWSFLEDLFIGNEITKKYGASLVILPGLKVIHNDFGSHGSASISVMRMRVLYRYYLWSRLSGKKSLTSYILGMLANYILDLRNYSYKVCFTEYFKMYSLVRLNNDISMRKINEYIFKKD